MSPPCQKWLITNVKHQIKTKLKTLIRKQHFEEIFLRLRPPFAISDGLILNQSWWSHGAPIACASSGKVKLTESVHLLSSVSSPLLLHYLQVKVMDVNIQYICGIIVLFPPSLWRFPQKKENQCRRRSLHFTWKCIRTSRNTRVTSPLLHLLSCFQWSGEASEVEG